MPTTCRVPLVLGLLLLGWTFDLDAATNGVVIVTSESGGAYAEVVTALRTELTGTRVEISVLESAEAAERTQAGLVVAVGAQACRALADGEQRLPLLCTLLPQAAFEVIAASPHVRPKLLSAVWLDQPIDRQMNLIRLALPGRTRIGVLLGAESAAFADRLTAAAARRNLELAIARVGKTDAAVSLSLRDLLDDMEVFLAIPNGHIFNSGTIQNILRATISRRVPTLAFSEPFARAGAAIALFSTPAMVGTQTGSLVRQILRSGQMPAPQSPVDFDISINPTVARSLTLNLGDPAALKRRLRSLEGMAP